MLESRLSKINKVICDKAAVLFIPRIGSSEHIWMNGLYEAFCIIIVFSLIVYIGASGVVHSQREDKICKFLGNLSYPLYMTHYVLVYFYVAWVSNQSGITLWQAWHMLCSHFQEPLFWLMQV